MRVCVDGKEWRDARLSVCAVARVHVDEKKCASLHTDKQVFNAGGINIEANAGMKQLCAATW